LFVNERFELKKETTEHLSTLKPEFGYNGFGEMIFYRTYSRTKLDGSKENWHDVIKRVTEGTFSIRKDWYVKNHIHWDEEFWQDYAKGFAESMFKMYWLPPGRGLWAMGTDYVYERGSMALYNCAATTISDDIGSDIHWMMDCLMNGVGVGFEPIRNDDLKTYEPVNGKSYFTIDDTREGWIDSVKVLIDKHLKPYQSGVEFDYDPIRPAGI
jgi:ribonucleoside-triphosphate reductase (thioredoxin)